MFNFRIIYMSDGNQVIDPSFKTPYSSLTPSQMEDYIEMDKKLAYMERVKKKERKAAERRRKMERNPLWKIACLCGLV
jgi:hypothetical protein